MLWLFLSMMISLNIEIEGITVIEASFVFGRNPICAGEVESVWGDRGKYGPFSSGNADGYSSEIQRSGVDHRYQVLWKNPERSLW